MSDENLATDDPLPKEARERLEAEHGGEIITIKATVGKDGKNVFAFRLPTRQEVRRYRQLAQQKGRDPGEEMERLLLATVIYPGTTLEDRQAALSSFFDRYSMAVGSFGIKFQEGAGLDFEALAVVK